MALHRISDIVGALSRKGWDSHVPVAVIERASCPDQRVLRTTLTHVVDAVQALGSRPPGLFVVGYACKVIKDLPVDQKWVVEEGL
jgi:uroporphyrin-III C-methyltransferase